MNSAGNRQGASSSLALSSTLTSSRVHPFIEASPSLSVCQVRIDAARHSFLSVEKTDETGRLCRMHLVVHGLEGDVRGEVNGYYDDPHKAVGE